MLAFIIMLALAVGSVTATIVILTSDTTRERAQASAALDTEYQQLCARARARGEIS